MIGLVRVVKRKRTNLKDECFAKPKRIRNKTANQPTNDLYHISRDQFYHLYSRYGLTMAIKCSGILLEMVNKGNDAT